MKDLLKNGVIVLLVIAAGYIIFLRECKGTKGIAKDEMVIKKSVWDSIKAIANLPPQIIVKHDTIKGETVYVPGTVSKPEADLKDSTVNHYSDSLVKKDIDVGIKLAVRGTLLSLDWKYNPIIITHDTIKYIYVPKIVDRPVPVPKAGLFGYVIVGGNIDKFIPGVGFQMITKKNTVIGIQLQRLGTENIYGVKLGMKLF